MFVVLVAVLAAASSVDDAVAGTAVFVIEHVFLKLNPNSAASLWYINIQKISKHRPTHCCMNYASLFTQP